VERRAPFGTLAVHRVVCGELPDVDAAVERAQLFQQPHHEVWTRRPQDLLGSTVLQMAGLGRRLPLHGGRSRLLGRCHGIDAATPHTVLNGYVHCKLPAY